MANYPKLHRLCGLWTYQTKNDDDYYAGSTDLDDFKSRLKDLLLKDPEKAKEYGVVFKIFKNSYKDSETDPDHVLYVSVGQQKKEKVTEDDLAGIF